jgi:DNA replication protein DnaC
MRSLEDRYGRTATIIVSQLPVESWHEMRGDPTIADAILDRLVHTAYRLTPRQAEKDA